MTSRYANVAGENPENKYAMHQLTTAVTGSGDQMTLQEAVRTCLQRKYADFSGRASRAEYWWFALFSWIIGVPVFLVLLVVALITNQPVLILLYFVVWLALIVPTVAVAVRRLHDTNRSGWYYLLAFVPFGGFVLLAFMLSPSREPNDYGPGGTTRYGSDTAVSPAGGRRSQNANGAAPAGVVTRIGVTLTDGYPLFDGVGVSHVEPGSAAAIAGLRVGDLLLSIDSNPVRRASSAGALLAGRLPGEELTVKWARDARTAMVEFASARLRFRAPAVTRLCTASVTLMPAPASAFALAPQPGPAQFPSMRRWPV